jgi:O-antigen biosynthesis protein
MPKGQFLPIKILDIELTNPLPIVEARDPITSQRYGGLFCLLRQSGRPIGALETELHGNDIFPTELQALIDRTLQASTKKSDTKLVQVTKKKSAIVPASIIVATRDRAASLSVSLDSLLIQNHPNFDIIVVDNAPSSNQTAELIKNRYGNSKIRYVREDKPGLGRAHNSGMEHVTAPVVAFTDDDVIADPQWLSALVSNFDKGEHVGCVTGLILPAELDTQAQIWTEKHGGFGKGFQRTIYDLKDHRPQSPLFPFTAGQFGSGANMAFRTETLRRVGSFDPALGAGTLSRGGDDLAAFHAIVNSGYRLVYEPEAIVWHHHRRDESGMQRQAFSYGMGLGAYLTKLVVDRPSNALRLGRILPTGLRHMMGASSPKTQRLPKDYPSSLIWRERLGILAGVMGYLRSRAAIKHDLGMETTRAAISSTQQE